MKPQHAPHCYTGQLVHFPGVLVYSRNRRTASPGSSFGEGQYKFRTRPSRQFPVNLPDAENEPFETETDIVQTPMIVQFFAQPV